MSEQIQRYDATLEFSKTGAFVRYPDHARIVAQLEAEIARLKEALHLSVEVWWSEHPPVPPRRKDRKKERANG